jgi:hypothetical protein
LRNLYTGQKRSKMGNFHRTARRGTEVTSTKRKIMVGMTVRNLKMNCSREVKALKYNCPGTRT